MSTEKELKQHELAVLYKVRLIIKQLEKDEYTKAELLELLDTIAEAKD